MFSRAATLNAAIGKIEETDELKSKWQSIVAFQAFS